MSKPKQQARPSLWVVAGLLSILLSAIGWLGGPFGSRRSTEAALENVDRSAQPPQLPTERAREPAKPLQQVPDSLKEAFREGRLVAAVKVIEAEADPTLWDSELDRLSAEVALADVPAAVRLLYSQSGSELAHRLGLRLVRVWADHDPQAAADWVVASLTGYSRAAAIDGLAIVWANRNGQRAAKWVRQLPDPEDRNHALVSAAYEVARTEAIEALGLASDLPPGEARDNLVAHGVGQWASSSPLDAANWAKQIPDENLRQRVLAETATAWARSDPIGAATLALESLAPGKPQEDAVVGIVQRWAQMEPEKAAAWVLEFPAGALRDTSLEELVQLWADQRADQAEHWLGALDLGPVRDVAVGAYVTKIAPRFPELAAYWATNITDEALRTRELEAIGEAWINNDVTVAHSWINQSALPEKTKARLLALGSQ
jgi:hypothetical protein